MTHRLPATILAAALTLLVVVRLPAGARHRDVGALVGRLVATPSPVASDAAVLRTSREKPVEDEGTPGDAAFDGGTPPVRVRTRLRCGTRPGDLDGDPGALGPWAAPVVTASSDRPTDALRTLLLAAVAGRRSAPSTAPPSRSL